MKKLSIAVLIFALLGGSARADAEELVLPRMLQTIRYADINRAALHNTCSSVGKSDPRPLLQSLCKRRNTIPDSVIESAAMPYLTKYVSKQLAEKAIRFWSSNPARSLKDQLILEVRLGEKVSLTPEEYMLFHLEEQSDHGIALRKFADDREQGQAVAKAMFRYSSTKDALEPEKSH